MTNAASSPARVLFVGASGTIGHLVRAAWDMTPPTGFTPAYQYRRDTRGDMEMTWSILGGAEPLATWVETHGVPKAMLVFAGVTPGPNANYALNVDLAVAALVAAQQVGIGRVMIASSSAVYGAWDAGPFDEEARLQPVNAYGASKVAMEQACLAAAAPSTDLCLLRIGNVAGADALVGNAVKATAEAPARLHRFADGNGPLRTYIGATTLAQVLETLVNRQGPLPDVLNVGAPKDTSMQSLLEALDAPWVFEDATSGAYQHITIDCRRLAHLHSFDPNRLDATDMIEDLRNLGRFT